MPQQTRPRFFPQNAETSSSGTFAEMESRLREEKASRLVELGFNNGRQAYVFFEAGAIIGAYTVEDGLSHPMSIAELTTSADREESTAWSARLPDKARRMAWLSLESEVQSRFEIGSASQWEEQLHQWKTKFWTGIVEIGSHDFAGFLVLWQGKVLESETILSDRHGFIAQLPSTQNLQGNPWKLVTYTTIDDSLAFQCLLLRQGVEWWSHEILARYQRMVGRKLLHILTHELSVLIEPWQWNISFAENTLLDAHFFSRPGDAANAYLTLFMEMGRHMSLLVGDMFTRRIFNETFAQMAPQERAALELHRLIPAAFSD